MKKIVFFCDAGIAGTNNAELVEVEDDVTDQELDRFAWQKALEWAESYGIYPEDQRESNGELGEEFNDSYSDNIEGYWEHYNPATHDHQL